MKTIFDLCMWNSVFEKKNVGWLLKLSSTIFEMTIQVENRINPYLEIKRTKKYIHIVIKRTEERMCALKMAADE